MTDAPKGTGPMGEEPAALEPESALAAPPATGGEQRRLAMGTAAIQAGRAVSIVTVLVVATALGRTLSLAQFGVYGLSLSFVGYVVFIQGSVEAAATKSIAEALDQRERDRAYTTAVVAYAVMGLLAGVVILAIGIAALGLFDIPASLRHESRLGIAGLALMALVSWPLRAQQNLLHGTQLFVLAAIAETASYVAWTALMLVLVLAVDAPLWLLIAGGGSLPLLTGLAAWLIVQAKRLRYRLRVRTLERSFTREFLSLSGYVLASAVTEILIYSVDRAVLASFRPAATVGLYEGVSRPQTLVRQVQAAMAVTVFPASSKYVAEGQTDRLRALLLRGTRYVVAGIAPIVIVLMVLAGPILDVWLGPRFAGASTALAIFVSYWLVGASMGVAGSMLFTAGKARQMAGYAWVLAILNLGLSIGLTSALGLNGVVLGTTLAYLLLFPYVIHVAVQTFDVTWGDFAREIWVPAYSLAAALAAVLVAIRLTIDPTGFAPVVGTALGGLALYWGAYWLIWLRPDERAFMKSLLRRAS